MPALALPYFVDGRPLLWSNHSKKMPHPGLRVCDGSEARPHTDSLLFELEDPDDQSHSFCHGEDGDGAGCPFASQLQILTRNHAAYHRQLKDDVTYFREQLMAEEGKVDIVDLACQLASIGHEVVVRSAVGGGTNCFRNLYHEFLCIRGKGDMEGVDLIVECNFRDHFSIPCSTTRYRKLLSCVPEVFVGTVQSLAPIVQAIAAEMNVAFASSDLTKPPWRNAQAMMSKWAPQRSKDWLPSSSPRSVAQSPPGGELASCRASSLYNGDSVLRRLSCSEQPIHCSSLGCATVLTPVGGRSTAHALPLASSHDVLVGFHKSALSFDVNTAARRTGVRAHKS